MQRIIAIDLARGFTVFFIPIIHCVMLYSKIEVHHSLFGSLLAFIAEWPGAQIFMLLMGVSFPLSKRVSSRKVLMKASVLLSLGYLLNYLKFVLPIEARVMPKEFLREYGGQTFTELNFFLTGDILQFAVIALLILLLVYRFHYPVLATLFLAVVALFASPILWGLHSDNIFLNHILSLFFGQPPLAYFPVFPWLVYPLTGLLIGVAIKRNFRKLHKHLFIVGSSVFLFEYLIQFTPYHFPKTSFYRTFPDQTLMHLGFAVAWFAMWHFISTMFSKNRLFPFLTFLGKNITLIYCIQWVLIFWCFPLFGYHQLSFSMSVSISFSAGATTFLVTYFITQLFCRNKPQQFSITKQVSFYES